MPFGEVAFRLGVINGIRLVANQVRFVRASQKAPDTVSPLLLERATDMLPHGKWSPFGRADTTHLDELKIPSAFGVLKNSDDVVFERDYLPVGRLVLQGTRQLVCAKLLDIETFMQQTAGTTEEMTPSRIKTFFRNMQRDTLEAFKRAGFHMWTATASAGEFVYTPALMVIADRSVGDKDSCVPQWGVETSHR